MVKVCNMIKVRACRSHSRSGRAAATQHCLHHAGDTAVPALTTLLDHTRVDLVAMCRHRGALVTIVAAVGIDSEDFVRSAPVQTTTGATLPACP